jgi:predicted transcriptional regulator
MQEGKLMMSENSPMTIQDFATIMSKSNKKMENILNKLIHLEMIIYKDNTYIIKNWYKYQSVDKYEKTLEQNRVRQKRFRDKKKEESNVNQTLGNGTEEIRKEIEDNKIDENIKVGENGSGFQTIDF